MSLPELFPEIVGQIADAPAVPLEWPLFLVAYWPHTRLWAIKCALEFKDADSPRLANEITALRKSGWRHITVLRLPPGGPWSAK